MDDGKSARSYLTHTNQVRKDIKEESALTVKQEESERELHETRSSQALTQRARVAGGAAS